MERDEFYKHRPASSFSRGRKLRARVEVYEEQGNGSFINKATGRIMTAKTFEIYKPAAAMDGITTIIMEHVLSINTDYIHTSTPKENPVGDNFWHAPRLIK
jgi:hypothetical protein